MSDSYPFFNNVITHSLYSELRMQPIWLPLTKENSQLVSLARDRAPDGIHGGDDLLWQWSLRHGFHIGDKLRRLARTKDDTVLCTECRVETDPAQARFDFGDAEGFDDVVEAGYGIVHLFLVVLRFVGLSHYVSICEAGALCFVGRQPAGEEPSGERTAGGRVSWEGLRCYEYSPECVENNAMLPECGK